jgi:Zn-dependent protease with chaperone function
MLKAQGDTPAGISRYFASHPPMHERLRNLKSDGK